MSPPIVFTKTGIAPDWENELATLDMKYRVLGGLDAVVEYLCASPMATYQERKAKLLEKGKAYPEFCAEIEQEYAITKENADTVRRINDHVFLFNRASREGRLTDRMYHRFYSHLTKLVRG